jgi:hypothetical protein
MEVEITKYIIKGKIMEEEIKKQNKFKKGCLGYLGAVILVIVLFFISYKIWIYILSRKLGTVFIQPRIYGRIYDKDTKKPVGYCLIKFYQYFKPTAGESLSGFDRERELATVISNKDGYYLIEEKFISYSPYGQKAAAFLSDLVEITRDGQILTVWFPGYKKYEIRTEGRKLLSGRIDIYLERPKTAEEAVEIIKYYRDVFDVLDRVFNSPIYSEKERQSRMGGVTTKQYNVLRKIYRDAQDESYRRFLVEYGDTDSFKQYLREIREYQKYLERIKTK